jgi:hypothetical protein
MNLELFKTLTENELRDLGIHAFGGETNATNYYWQVLTSFIKLLLLTLIVCLQS